MNKKNFEQSLKELENIVAELEKGDLPLDKALKIFEEGMKLSQFCSEKLNEAEKKIEILINDHSGMVSKKNFIDDRD